MKTWHRWPALLLLLAIHTQTNAGEDIKPDKEIVYKTVGETTLRLHVFFPSDHQAGDKRAGIVFFFGGGWVGGSPGQFYPHCRYLASRGMVAVSAEYRVKSGHGTSPYECVLDGKSAVRWLRLHAAELGIDPRRIAAGGGSAGGHVAAATGTLKGFREPAEGPEISARPNALVLFNPVFDNGPEGWGYERVKDRWREFSPLHNITDTAPPTIVLLGTKDKLIPVSTAQQYKKRMTDAGGRCDLHLYEGQPHGFFNFRDGENPYYNTTVYEADKFLASLGYVQGAPTIASEQSTATSP
ncbi:MAG: alpha/beta hydrolase fold domain-containing protein [Sedimentisphaerales bacterium]|nr:alpha/beta hydrolase fold domain-containing protein [Sedimentisphaerales bacterium]